MANGTIAFDTLQTSGQITGTAKSVDTDYVVNGSARAWQESVTSGTQTVNDSLNVSSITDEGTGLSTIAWTNSFGSVNYTAPFGRSSNNDATAIFVADAYSVATGSLSFATKFSDTNGSITVSDANFVSSSHNGDLA